MDSNLISSVNGQHESVDMPKFLQALKSGADHAVGNRFQHTKKPKSPRNPRPRLRPLIWRRDRNILPTQKNQNRRNTNHSKVPRSIKQGKPLLQGLNLLWSILWTALTKRPALTLTLGATSLAISITLFIHALTIFNATRYVRLTYTTLAILLEIATTLLIAISIMNIVHYRSYNPATKTTNNTMEHVN